MVEVMEELGSCSGRIWIRVCAEIAHKMTEDNVH